MSLPNGWTDDLTIPLPPGHTVEEMVDFVIAAAMKESPPETTCQELVTRFGLSNEDAVLAMDRVFGGIVRAATSNPANRPSREKDPVAWTSFQRATNDPSIIVALRPDLAPAKQKS